MKSMLRSIMAGLAAGAVNGTFGAGGGMVLIPVLRTSGEFSDEELFRCSIAMILPMSLITLLSGSANGLPWQEAWPYLAGAVPGGIAAALTANRIPTKWLHRFLGVMIIYGGIRYLC